MAERVGPLEGGGYCGRSCWEPVTRPGKMGYETDQYRSSGDGGIDGSAFSATGRLAQAMKIMPYSLTLEVLSTKRGPALAVNMASRERR